MDSSGGLLSLKWNNHTATFTSVLGHLRDKNTYSDVSIACEGKMFAVHKLVLSTCSNYFEKIFTQTDCKHPIIVLKDTKASELEALLNYMYLGEVNVLQADLAGLIKSAECLRIKGLAAPDDPAVLLKKLKNDDGDGGCSNNVSGKRQSSSSSSSYNNINNNSNTSSITSPPNKRLRRNLSSTNEDNNSSSESRLKQKQHSSSPSQRSSSLSSSADQRNSEEQATPVKQQQTLSSQQEDTAVPAQLAPFVKSEAVSPKQELLHDTEYYTGDSTTAYDADNSAAHMLDDIMATTLDQSGEGNGNYDNHQPEVYHEGANPMAYRPAGLQGGLGCTGGGATLAGAGGVCDSNFELMSDHGESAAALGAGLFPSTNQAMDSFRKTLAVASCSNVNKNTALSCGAGQHKRASSYLGRFGPTRQTTTSGAGGGTLSISSHAFSHTSRRNTLAAKVFPCLLCPKTFNRRDNLTLHIRTHTGEKPYLCPHCTYRTTISSNVYRHMRKKHPAYPTNFSSYSGAGGSSVLDTITQTSDSTVVVSPSGASLLCEPSSTLRLCTDKLPNQSIGNAVVNELAGVRLETILDEHAAAEGGSSVRSGTLHGTVVMEEGGRSAAVEEKDIHFDPFEAI